MSKDKPSRSVFRLDTDSSASDNFGGLGGSLSFAKFDATSAEVAKAMNGTNGNSESEVRMPSLATKSHVAQPFNAQNEDIQMSILRRQTTVQPVELQVKKANLDDL